MRARHLVVFAIAIALGSPPGIQAFGAGRSRRRRISPRRRDAQASTASMPATGSTWWAAASAAFDCDHDGRAIILLAGGENPAKFYRNVTKVGGALKFEARDQRPRARPSHRRLSDRHRRRRHHGPVVLARRRESSSMRGLGDCRFERANEEWDFRRRRRLVRPRFAATWEQGPTWPTLAIGSYIDRTQDIEPWGIVHRQLAAIGRRRGGESRAPFARPMPLKPSFCALSMLFTDWNQSGTPQPARLQRPRILRGRQEQMWRVEPGKPPALYAAKDGWKHLRIWGMGIASPTSSGDGCRPRSPRHAWQALFEAHRPN